MNKLILLYLFSFSLCSLTILSPSKLSEELLKITNNNKQIQHKIGNFGKIPYGKTISGKIYIQKQNDGSNYWCDYSKTTNIKKTKDSPSIILVDHSDDCKYTKKAYNVMKRGGDIMLLVFDQNTLIDDYNIDDILSEIIDIPSIIIPKNIGDLITKYINNESNVVLSISFSGIRENNIVEMNLFLRSDDIKSISFFNEFKEYKELLGDKFKFKPIYKYHSFNNEDFDNSLNAKSEKSCIKKTINYCSTDNNDLNILNPRLILLENIRQSCIYNEFGIDKYWNYMIFFNENCLKIGNINFSEECSSKSISKNNLNLKKIDTCMNNLIMIDSKIDEDYKLYENMKIYKYPQITLNGIKYKENWYSKNIFNNICQGFIDDDTICSITNREGNKEDNDSTFWFIIFIIIISSIIVLIILLIVYKKFVNSSLDKSINEKIEYEAIKAFTNFNKTQSKNTFLPEIEMSNQDEKKIDLSI